MNSKLMSEHEKAAIEKRFNEIGERMESPADNNTWPEPGELPGKLLPVPSLAESLIPEPFRPWLSDIAARIQCPLEYPVIGALVSVGAVVGRKIGICPKRQDDWLVVPHPWGGIVGRPGRLKSPALAEPMKPLYRLEFEARKAYQEKLKEYELQQTIRKAQKENMENEIRKAIKKGDDPEVIKARLSKPSENDPPVPRRYIVNDTTVEKLGELLNQNPQGLLLFRDELTGWLKKLDSSGHENDRAFYLEAWNGTGPYTYDRIGRGTIHIEAACVSLLGGIQPGPLESYLRGALRGGVGDDGLIQRFQLLVYPDPCGKWRNVDRWPDTEAKNRAFELFRKLDVLEPESIGATVEDTGVPYLRFSADAQDFFDIWRGDLEAKIRSDEEHPIMEAHLAKYRSLMPSLALIFHLLDVVSNTLSGPVSKQACAMAAAWCDFLEAHARRIYQSVTERYATAANLLGMKIKSGKLSSPFATRDVYRNGWSGLLEPEDIERAVEILEDASWVRIETIPSGLKGGRPTARYHVNPRLPSKK